MSARVTLVRDVGLVDGRRVDLVVADDLITAVEPAGRAERDGATVVDATGWLALPPLADPHVHLDKALTIDDAPNRTGDLAGAIEAWMAYRVELREDDVLRRARAATRIAALHGVTALRTHVDTGADIGLTGLRALVRLRDEVRDVLDLQIIAGHGLPVTGPDGEAGTRVLRAALEAGADGVGGAPSLDPDPVGAWRALWSIAHEHGVPLDLHVDETLDPGVFLLEQIARDAAQRAVPLTVGHVVSLSVQPEAARRRVARELAAAEVPVVTLPQTNLYLQGRGPSPLVPRGLTAVHELVAEGVLLASGADNLGDPFNPVSRIDPLETASLLLTAGHVDAARALDAVSDAARRVMGLSAPALEHDASADFVLIRATSLLDAVGRASPERQVWRRGVVVAATSLDADWLPDRSTPYPAPERNT